MSLRKALGEMALLSPDFLLGGPVIIRCDNKAALSLCKDRKEGLRRYPLFIASLKRMLVTA
jgi:hypothetical protein